MAWPPPVLPTNRTDALNQQANHPADHNATNQAVNDIVATVSADRRTAAATATYNGAATNGALIPWSITGGDPAWGAGGTALPVPVTGVWAITVSIAYSGAEPVNGYVTVNVTGAAFGVFHGPTINVGTTIIVPLQAGDTISVLVGPGLTMPGSSCNMWLNRVAG